MKESLEERLTRLFLGWPLEEFLDELFKQNPWRRMINKNGGK